ncbi:hypothetical protein HWV62_11691 [Athelia sp. TMB]|nr:hypothetical protein HWV62_32187 [Athelia sp. TMB]KAF7984743.1 hypothetical protein HWV62_11691 [Athelia sp. TMB]
MSVLFETSLGDLVIDLEIESCPKTCENFLKLCKLYYYNLNAFFNVSKDFLAQAGDPTASGTGGECVWSLLDKSAPRYFKPELVPRLKHTHKGTVSMAIAPAIEVGPNRTIGGCGSQFFVTLGDGIDYLDGKHAVFGHVVEGLETLEKLNEVYVDADGRPFKDVRIRHVLVLDDPFPDPPGLVQPPASPTRPPDNSTRIAEDEDPLATLPEEEEERLLRLRAAEASALTLEMVGDLPFANVRPPENVLFVCKLNPVTRDEDLELIFSRFGVIMSCQVIRDKKTGDSLQYAFIEFDKREDAEQAYFKMQNVLVDDRRIWVDFSQSVAKLNNSWSNNPAMGPKGGRGKGARPGFAGRDDLEQTRRYRDADDDRRAGGYGMVFDVPGGERDSSRRRKRSRSRSKERDSHKDSRRNRSRSPMPPLSSTSTIMVSTTSYAFDAEDADIILLSTDNAMFRVHKCILAAASTFFQSMFTLPQKVTSGTHVPAAPISETSETVDALLRFVYPVENPDIHSLDKLNAVLAAACKYDFDSVVSALRKILVSPRFLEAHPTRVFAIASRYELEPEAQIASSHTLNVNVLDCPLSDDLKFITAHSYVRLLNLHRRRADAAQALLKVPDEVKCMQCNGHGLASSFAAPKWWKVWEEMAKKELAIRPTSDVIFSMGFLAKAVDGSGCGRCAGSVLASFGFLGDLKQRIDELPATI